MNHLNGIKYNYSYFSIFIDEMDFGVSRDDLNEFLKSFNYIGRRYFYPLISQFPTYRGLTSSDPANLPIAEQKTKQVLCLPIYPDLDLIDASNICTLIKSMRK
jgi:dTDP-4-amino-4,6-dideoxygalactose transaminase